MSLPHTASSKWTIKQPPLAEMNSTQQRAHYARTMSVSSSMGGYDASTDDNLATTILAKYTRSSNLRTTATQLIGTIGPACNNVETLSEMLRAGMTVARFDFSAFTLDYHIKAHRTLSEAMKNTGFLCATMVDTKGPEIQVVRDKYVDEHGDVRISKHALHFSEGSTVSLTADTTQSCSNATLPVSYSRIHGVLEPGDRIIVTRYLITGTNSDSVTLEVTGFEGQDVVCRVVVGATLDGALNMFLKKADSTPVRTDLPIISKEDQDMVQSFYSATRSLDFLAVSYTSCKADIVNARQLCKGIGAPETSILAKLENLFSLDNFDELVVESDGVVLSRGRLGQDVPVEKFPRVQKHLIKQCNIHGKLIWITRVVDTMSEAPRPTRAEATDVANAVMDGADGIMLGAETLRGLHPVTSIETVLQIAREAESYYIRTGAADNHFQSLVVANRGDVTGSFQKMSSVEACASSVVRASSKLGAAAIICFASTGTTARLISKWRPAVPVICVVQPRLKASNGLHWQFSGLGLAKQLLACRGVIPMLSSAVIGPFNAGEEDGSGRRTMTAGGSAAPLRDALRYGIELGLFEHGANDHVVITTKLGGDHTIKVVNVDEMLAQSMGTRKSSAMFTDASSYENLADLSPTSRSSRSNSSASLRRSSLHPNKLFSNSLPSAARPVPESAPAPATVSEDVASRLMQGDTAEGAAHDYLRELERRLEQSGVSSRPDTPSG